MNMDLTTAALKHSTWKLRLRNFLDGKGGLTPGEATSHRDCDLGRWIETEGFKKYGAMPEMKELDRDHQSLHRMVKTVVDFKAAGKVKEAEIALQKVEPLSNHIVELLHKIDARTKPASRS